MFLLEESILLFDDKGAFFVVGYLALSLGVSLVEALQRAMSVRQLRKAWKRTNELRKY